MNIDHWLPQFALSNRAPVELAGSLASLWLGNKSTIAAHFDFPDNFFDDYEGRPAAAAQEMLIAATEEQIAAAHGHG